MPETAANATAETLGLNPKHFEMLRIARLRGLRVRKLGETVYAVTSHTRRADGFEWVVSEGVCSCPAKGYCTHLAAQVDYYFLNESPGGDFALYNGAMIEDRTQLRLRIRANELTRNDKIYVRYAMKVYAAKLAGREAEVAPAPIRRVESRGKVREFVGGFQI